MTDKLYEILNACEDKYTFVVSISDSSDFQVVFQVKAYNLPYIYVQMESCFVENCDADSLAVFIFDSVVREIKRGLRR